MYVTQIVTLKYIYIYIGSRNAELRFGKDHQLIVTIHYCLLYIL